MESNGERKKRKVNHEDKEEDEEVPIEGGRQSPLFEPDSDAEVDEQQQNMASETGSRDGEAGTTTPAPARLPAATLALREETQRSSSLAQNPRSTKTDPSPSPSDTDTTTIPSPASPSPKSPTTQTIPSVPTPSCLPGTPALHSHTASYTQHTQTLSRLPSNTQEEENRIASTLALAILAEMRHPDITASLGGIQDALEKRLQEAEVKRLNVASVAAKR